MPEKCFLFTPVDLHWVVCNVSWLPNSTDSYFPNFVFVFHDKYQSYKYEEKKNTPGKSASMMCAVELSGVKSGCQTIGLQSLKDSLIKSSVWELIICYGDWKERKDLFVLCVAKWCPMMTQMVKMMVAGTTIPTKEDQNNHTFCRWEGKQNHHKKITFSKSVWHFSYVTIVTSKRW